MDLETQIRDRRQQVIIPFLEPELGLEAWDQGFGCGSPFLCTRSPPHTEDLGLFTGFDKVVVVAVERLLGSFLRFTFVSAFLMLFCRALYKTIFDTLSI